ncbi:MAG TPA: respiratory nitrate reductase subunit gamma [Thermodesulfobacteriota bacterium]|nr:respiratory nitrate reductase subunit gamma [Thermodesulfobacteriota bacterium]
MMGDDFLFGIFPYVAFVLAIAGGVYRYYSDRFSYSSLSSQFLENRALFWGSVPWHYGIVLILLTHLFGGLFSGLSLDLLRVPTRLFILELIGASLGLIAFVGIVLLIIRRIADSRVQSVTSFMDWILLILLAAQVAAGLTISILYRWGSLWYLDTAVPWFWSIGRLNPNFGTIAPLPWIVKFHMFNAFIVIALFPFTRLVHIFTVPITYLWRPYQVVIWNRSAQGLPGGMGMSGTTFDTERRGFLKLATGVLASLVCIAVGVPVIGTLIGPAFRSRKTAWTKVGNLNELSTGEPTRLTFAVKTTSAYITETVLHDVWVIKQPSSEVTVFSPICPHLGCEYNWNAQTSRFECPCHGSVYGINGRVLGGPAPRPLDTLPTKIQAEDLYVEWEVFKVGTHEKVPV